MKFKWDEQKNQANIKKHELDFADAHKVFDQPSLVNLDDREDYGENRWIAIGLLNGRMVVIVFTELDEETIRVISFRKATNDERKRYERAYQDEFGAS
jgi:hypothetical protein